MDKIGRIQNWAEKSQQIYRSSLLLLAFTFYGFFLSAQNFGSHPNHQNWQIIQTDFGKVIYPKRIEKTAFRAASYLEHETNSNPISLKKRKKKLGLVLQNTTLNPNAYVALSPYRSEFYITPPPSTNELGTNDWINLLSIHEQRHFQQYSNSLNGLTKWGYYLAGEGGWAFFQFLSLPNWFTEGDAVLSETALSKSGRGRLPSFSVFQRSIAAQGKTYRYEKIRNGSFKDLVPDHYRWGYLMMAQLTVDKGFDIIQPILHDATSYRSVFYPFGRSLKKHSGYNPKELYGKAWRIAKMDWNDRLENRELTPTEALTAETLKVVTRYHYPQFVNDSSWVVRKSTNKKTDAFVLQTTDGSSEVILRPGSSSNSFFHYQHGFLSWTEQRSNARRAAQNYEDIFVYDIKQKKKQRITKKGRYFSPIVDPNTASVYAIQYGEDQLSKIVRINLKTKKDSVLRAFSSDVLVSRFAINKKGNILAYFKRKEGRMTLFTYDLIKKKETQFMMPTAQSMDAIKIKSNFIYFGASFNQIDNIYRTRLDGSGSIEQLTEVPLGAYEADYSPDGKQLIFTEAIYNGFKVASLTIDDAKNPSAPITEPYEQDWNYPQLRVNQDYNSEITTKHYEAKDYKGFFRGFRLHSWPITTTTASQGIRLLFDNYLNDLSAEVGGGYNFNEKGQYYHAEMSYGKWFPVFTLYGDYNYRRIKRLDEFSNLHETAYRQKTDGVNISIPLRWQLGNYGLRLKASIGYQWANLSNRLDHFNEYYSLANSSLQFSLLRRKARQQLFSPLGISSSLKYGRSIDKLDNERFENELRLFLPSLFPTNSLQLSYGYKRELKENTYQHIDQFTYARGYEGYYSDSYQRFSLDYHFPLFYPDWGFAGISYFKRIRADLFYDYGIGGYITDNSQFHHASAGVELYFDNVFFNVVPLSFGVRTSFLSTETTQGRVRYAILISSSF